MSNFCAKCVCMLILQFVLVPAALSNTLTLGEDGEVFAETDRYQVRFKMVTSYTCITNSLKKLIHFQEGQMQDFQGCVGPGSMSQK